MLFFCSFTRLINHWQNWKMIQRMDTKGLQGQGREGEGIEHPNGGSSLHSKKKKKKNQHYIDWAEIITLLLIMPPPSRKQPTNPNWGASVWFSPSHSSAPSGPYGPSCPGECTAPAPCLPCFSSRRRTLHTYVQAGDEWHGWVKEGKQWNDRDWC